MRDRVKAVIIGQPRGGKSFFAEKLLKKFNRVGASFVYNHGRPSDFEDYTPAEYLGDAVLSIKGKDINMERLSIPGAKIKIVRIVDYKEQDRFYSDFYQNCKNSFLLIDDAIATVKSGHTPKELETIFATADHLQIDAAAVFHCLNLVPPKMFVYGTHIIQFRTKTQPRLSNRIPDFEIMVENFERLKDLPPYYHYIFDTKTGENKLMKPLSQ